MKRVLISGALLLGAALATASTNAEIRCGILGLGGERTSSANHSLRSYAGPTVVGTSASAGHALVHGPAPCGAPVPTGIEDGPGTLPTALRLHQNAPNPFNPRTTIRYEVPADAFHVRLRVYDLSGRLVRTLVDGPQPAGRASVVWNGRDDSNRSVSSGVYLYELTGSGQRITHKMTLVK